MLWGGKRRKARNFLKHAPLREVPDIGFCRLGVGVALLSVRPSATTR